MRPIASPGEAGVMAAEAGTGPRRAGEWLSHLEEHGVAGHYDPEVAEFLRVISNQGPDAVALVCGPTVLGYLPWLRDGLSMTSKLMVLLEPDQRPLVDVVQPQLEMDIRVASHVQDLVGFATDVAEHEVDLVVVDAEVAEKGFDALLGLAGDSAKVVVVGDSGVRARLTVDRGGSYFWCEVGSMASMATRKNRQHRVRRRT